MSSPITVEAFLDKLDPAQSIVIRSNPLGMTGGVVLLAGTTSSKAIKVRRMAIKGGGNQGTAPWRHRHGGAWMMPINTKFKVGK